MYLVRTINGDKVLDSANEVKNLNKKDIINVYSLSEVDFDDLVSTSDIRDCIYKYLKGRQTDKEDIVDYVSEALSVKKNDVSKVITAMKKEKIIYVVKEWNWLGID